MPDFVWWIFGAFLWIAAGFVFVAVDAVYVAGEDVTVGDLKRFGVLIALFGVLVIAVSGAVHVVQAVSAMIRRFLPPDEKVVFKGRKNG